MTDLLALALERIRDGDVPRPVASYWRRDRKPCKHDQCAHGKSMWQDCGECISAFAAEVLDTAKARAGSGVEG